MPPIDTQVVAFVREVKRQRDLLERAILNDDVAVELMRQDDDRRRQRKHGDGHRRIWTRRDRRLFEASADGDVPPWRTTALLSRFTSAIGERSYRSLFAAAVAEVKQTDRFDDVIDQLSKVAAAHAGFLLCVAESLEQLPWTMDPSVARRLHNDALSKLAVEAPETRELLQSWLRHKGDPYGIQ